MVKKDRHMSVNGRSRILQRLADHMKAGMNHTDAANTILNEESPGPPFDLERRREINAVVFDTKDAAKIVRGHEKPVTWQVKSLDVWGNEEDGFEVNQEFSAGEIQIPAMTDDADLLKLMKKEGFIKDNVRSNQIEFEDTGSGFIEIKDAKSGEPLYFLYGPS
jgi:hypothetical protein